MLVIVEGLDRVGKTTLVNKLKDYGFITLKDEFINDEHEHFGTYSYGKCETAVTMIKKLVDQGYNVVMDRLHLTEMVYGKYLRHDIALPDLSELDKYISENIPSLLVMVKPTDLSEGATRAEMDIRSYSIMNDLFEKAFELSSINKMSCTYYTTGSALKIILSIAYKYDIYFASPFFTPEQIEREERLKKHLKGMGYKVYSPKEACNLPAKSSDEDREKTFQANCEAIRQSKAVFAITDGKDMGTIWEAGFAYGIGKPILYYAETLGNNPFNLMLAQSGKATFKFQGELTDYYLDQVLNGYKNRFEGDIE